MSVVRVDPDTESNGLALMLGDLIRQNLEDNPGRTAELGRMRGRVAIVAQDAEVAVTLRFDGTGVLVQNGIVGLPDVTVRANSDDVIQMSLLEMGRFGLPNPRGTQFRKLLGSMRAGQVQVFGGLVNFPLVLRLTRLVAVAGT